MSLEIKIIALLLVLGSVLGLGTWYGHTQFKEGARIQRLTDQAEVDAQKLEARDKLAAETGKVAQLERELNQLKSQQEIEDEGHQKTVNDLRNRLLRAPTVPGRLRDPNQASGCGAGSSGASASAASVPVGSEDHRAKAGGLLSEELTGLLQRLQFEADEINVAFASCKAYSTEVERKFQSTP